MSYSIFPALILLVSLLQACGGGGGGATPAGSQNGTAGFVISVISGNTSESGTTATFTVRLNSQPTADVTIPVSSSDTTEGTVAISNLISLTFTSANWSTPQTVTVTGVSDLLADGNVTYSILLGATSSADSLYNGLNPDDVAVTNSDVRSASYDISGISGQTSEAGTSAKFTVRLGAQPSANVTIPVFSGDLSEGTVSPASLTFTSANWSTPQTVTVTGVSDLIADGSVTYNIELRTPTTSTDPLYNILDPGDVAVTNTESTPASFVISPTSGTTSESVTTFAFTVRLGSQPTADVTIPVSSGDLTEGTVAPASLTFNSGNWNSNQTVTVTGVNDNLADGPITYYIELGSPSSSADTSYRGIDPSDVAVTNTDVRFASFGIGAISGHTSESGAIATFTVRLGSQPIANVTIPVSCPDTTEGTVTPASLIFTNSNWYTDQTVTVTGVGDILADGDVAYSIVLGNTTSGDSIYNNQNPDDVAVINDNVPPKSLTVTWDYYDANYVADYSVKGIRVYVVGYVGDCHEEDPTVINTTRTITCSLPASLPTPVSFTLAAYDTQGYESPQSEVIVAVPGL